MGLYGALNAFVLLLFVGTVSSQLVVTVNNLGWNYYDGNPQYYVEDSGNEAFPFRSDDDLALSRWAGGGGYVLVGQPPLDPEEAKKQVSHSNCKTPGVLVSREAFFEGCAKAESSDGSYYGDYTLYTGNTPNTGSTGGTGDYYYSYGDFTSTYNPGLTACFVPGQKATIPNSVSCVIDFDSDLTGECKPFIGPYGYFDFLPYHGNVFNGMIAFHIYNDKELEQLAANRFQHSDTIDSALKLAAQNFDPLANRVDLSDEQIQQILAVLIAMEYVSRWSFACDVKAAQKGSSFNTNYLRCMPYVRDLETLGEPALLWNCGNTDYIVVKIPSTDKSLQVNEETALYDFLNVEKDPNDLKNFCYSDTNPKICQASLLLDGEGDEPLLDFVETNVFYRVFYDYRRAKLSVVSASFSIQGLSWLQKFEKETFDVTYGVQPFFYPPASSTVAVLNPRFFFLNLLEGPFFLFQSNIAAAITSNEPTESAIIIDTNGAGSIGAVSGTVDRDFLNFLWPPILQHLYGSVSPGSFNLGSLQFIDVLSGSENKETLNQMFFRVCFEDRTLFPLSTELSDTTEGGFDSTYDIYGTVDIYGKLPLLPTAEEVLGRITQLQSAVGEDFYASYDTNGYDFGDPELNLESQIFLEFFETFYRDKTGCGTTDFCNMEFCSGIYLFSDETPSLSLDYIQDSIQAWLEVALGGAAVNLAVSESDYLQCAIIPDFLKGEEDGEWIYDCDGNDPKCQWGLDIILNLVDENAVFRIVPASATRFSSIVLLRGSPQKVLNLQTSDALLEAETALAPGEFLVGFCIVQDSQANRGPDAVKSKKRSVKGQLSATGTVRVTKTITSALSDSSLPGGVNSIKSVKHLFKFQDMFTTVRRSCL